jgi:MFS family permease
MPAVGQDKRKVASAAAIAWLITAFYYFAQYMMRSAPSVMVPELTSGFAISVMELTWVVGLFYYSYAPFSLVAGAALDRFSPRKVLAIAAGTLAVGAALFAVGDPTLAAIGRLLQGAGGVFALLGAAYIISIGFPPSQAGTLFGLTQMFGLAGGAAGQFLTGPLIAHGMGWHQFWLVMALLAGTVAALLLIFVPEPKRTVAQPAHGLGPSLFGESLRALGTVMRNPQSILCGLIAGLLFIPTTIFDMVWGVRYLQEAHDLPYGIAVMRSASVPLGWMIGCPILGLLSDRLGRRKPVIIGGSIVLLICLALILYGPPDAFPPFSLGLVAGIASGSAMLTYAVIKEANAPEHGATATGVVNFINFSLSAVLGPVFAGLLHAASEGGERELAHYQEAFRPLLYGVAIALILALLLRETGSRSRQPSPATLRRT